MRAIRLSGRQLFGTLAALLIALLALDQVLPPPIQRGTEISALVTDRSGKPLRAFATQEGRWRFHGHLDRIDPRFRAALIRVEDKRFYTHGGVDWLGLMRAGVQTVRHGEIVSGGSTITMQTARMLERRPRTLSSKFIEIVRAHQLEARLSKDEILELYLTLTPYGGNLEGVRAASWSYFGHEADRLSDDEIALLIALPQSPEARRPDRHPERAARARDWVAKKLVSYDFFTAQDAEEIASTNVPGYRRDFPDRAWHGSAAALSAGAYGDVRSSLDSRLQAEVERIALTRAEGFGADVQVSVLVVNVPTRGVRAMVGSASRTRAGGWIDLTAQPRSPGSTLKPFIYALAFDDGAAAPDTRISDLPRQFDGYQPENFDRMFHGDVRIAEALQHSLNLPAVIMLDKIGPDRFAAQLTLAGAAPRITGAGESAGLALALGGAGLTARELAVLYAALGDEGHAKPLVWRASDEKESHAAAGQRFLSEESAAEILRILKNAPMPEGRMPGRLTANAPQVAFKTGTSWGYRDAWAAGVSGDHVIIVWVGRADGAPRTGITGRDEALPVLFEIADRVALHLEDEGAGATRLVTETRFKSKGALRAVDTDRPPEILFPPNGSELWGGDATGDAARPFVLAGRGEGGLNWFVDGVPCATDAAGSPLWQPDRPGFYTVTAVDALGRSSRVRVRVRAPDEPI